MGSAAEFPALLAGVRILDFTHALAGPFSTQMLADLGAEVIKVEPPTGDKTREIPPHFIGGTSLYFHAINRNKRSVALDLKSEEGQRALRELVPTADVAMMNFSPGVADRLGLAHSQLSQLNPMIVTCTLSSFGPHATEDIRGTDLVAQAMAGAMSITGYADAAPARAGVPTADLTGGFYTTIAVLAGLQYRRAQGRGIALDTSLFHAQLSLLNYMGAYAAHTGEPIQRLGSGYPATVPAQAFATSDDRWLVIDAGFDHHFSALCVALERPDLAAAPAYRDRASRLTAKTELIAALQAAFATRPRDEWVRRLHEHGVPAAPVNDTLEALYAPVAVEGGLAPMEVAGQTVRVLRTPIWADGTNAHPMVEPEGIGQSNAVLLGGLSHHGEERDRAGASSR